MRKLNGSWRAIRLGLNAIVVTLAACGGGGSPGGAASEPSVSSAATGPVMYGHSVLLTVNGSRLDQGLQVSATGCRDVAIQTTAPTLSNASTAYYKCTASAVGAGQFVLKRASDGGTLATAAFNVPMPQVSLTFSNGAAVAGSIVLTLAPDKTPVTVDNFLGYVNSGFYVGTAIHRVSPGFVIQGGGYAAPLDSVAPVLKPTGDPIALEVNKGLSNIRGTIAMARTSAPNSATSQFFINLGDNSRSLDPTSSSGTGYAVFGAVTGGSSSIDTIAAAPCTIIPSFLPSGDCTPSPNVVVTSAVQTQ